MIWELPCGEDLMRMDEIGFELLPILGTFDLVEGWLPAARV